MRRFAAALFILVAAMVAGNARADQLIADKLLAFRRASAF